MWYMLAVSVHIVLSLLLILIIILQPGKGGDVGAAFGGGGGGGGNLFGPRGPTNILQQATTFVAVGFMCTSITLAIYSNKALLAGGGDVLDEMEQLEQEREAEADREAEELQEALDALPEETPEGASMPPLEPAPGEGAGEAEGDATEGEPAE